MNIEQTVLVTELAKLRPSSTFLTLNGYRNAHSEVANYSIVFHMSYKNAVAKSLDFIQTIVPESSLEAIAKSEIITSLNNSLTKLETTPEEELQDNYMHFKGADGNYIKGVKYHMDSRVLHLYGLIVHKKVIIPGDYPKANKRPLTIAKDKLLSNCPVSKFRQFRLVAEQLDNIKVQNTSLLPP